MSRISSVARIAAVTPTRKVAAIGARRDQQEQAQRRRDERVEPRTAFDNRQAILTGLLAQLLAQSQPHRDADRRLRADGSYEAAERPVQRGKLFNTIA